MNKILTLLFIVIGGYVFGQDLQIQTFGNPKNKVLIFLHGGPGYNSVSFETTTAVELAKNGFFVISYDRRGEGRNDNLKAEYTFVQTFADLQKIYDTYKIEKAILIGHSFGGVIGTLFAEKYPKKVKALVLVSVPISMQETLKNIIAKSKNIYKNNEDKINLNYIAMLEKMDTASLAYSSYCFMHAMANGFYATNNPNDKAKELYKTFKTDTLLKKYASKNDFLAPKGLWKNENYTTISLSKELKSLVKEKVPIFAFYGKDDGLFSEKQVKELKDILGENNVMYLSNCSHNIFIDQQVKFINFFKKKIQ